MDVEVTDNGSHQVGYYIQTEKGTVTKCDNKMGQCISNLIAYILNDRF